MGGQGFSGVTQPGQVIPTDPRDYPDHGAHVQFLKVREEEGDRAMFCLPKSPFHVMEPCWDG